jgi:hypothetical protein
MRNKKRTAPAMEIPDNVTEREFKVILDRWMTRGGYQQIEINADNVATEYAQYRKDLPMFVIEQWYKQDWEKQLKICRESGSPERWITRVMNLSIKSNSSPFHSLYRKFSIKSREQFDSTTNLAPMWSGNEAEDYSENICVKCLKQEITKLDFYEKMLVDAIIFQGKKPRRFAEDNNLDMISVTNNWQGLKKRLIKACQPYR